MEHIGLITYADGTTKEYGYDGITHAIKCPNFRSCGETSLSLGWMIHFLNKDEDEVKTLACFQCDTHIGTFKDNMTLAEEELNGE